MAKIHVVTSERGFGKYDIALCAVAAESFEFCHTLRCICNRVHLLRFDEKDVVFKYRNGV